MQPYLKLQLIYVLASGVLCAAVWLAWGGNKRAAKWPRRRLVLSALSVALPCLMAWAGIRVIDHPHSAYQFGAIAIGFYAFCGWLPMFALVRFRHRIGKHKKRLDYGLTAFSALLMAGGAYAALVEPNRIVTELYTVRLEQWPETTRELRVIHVSDLQTVGSCWREVRATEVINSFDPDLIVVTGDYVAGPFNRPDASIDAARSFLQALRARLGVVCVAGHSEPEWVRERIFAGLDVTYLTNEEVEFDLGDSRTLRVFGAPAQGLDLLPLEPRLKAGYATLVATHMPDVSGQLDGRGVDLHLAGHTHGGQVAFPLIGPPMTLSELPREYARGLHRFGDHWLNVNPGIGMEGHHAPRIRFLCPPQIDLILLEGSGPPLPPAEGPSQF